MKYKIALISYFPFPKGLAATNRIISYSKGLVHNGCQVDVFIPEPSGKQRSQFSDPDSGCFDGINYYYTNGRYNHKVRLFRLLSHLTLYGKIAGFAFTLSAIYKRSREYNYNCILLSTDRILSLWIYSRFAYFLKIPSVFIFDEFPSPIRTKLKDRLPRWKILLLKKALKEISGYISISETLEKFYSSIVKKPALILSSIVDITKFENLDETNSEPYICYCGNMEITKDNVDLIIKAFKYVNSKFPTYKLRFYGPVTNETSDYLNSIINFLNLNDSVFLMGRVDADLIPSILKKAKILVSSQPNTTRASGGFPTKLGEYLASGKPVLLTDVGETSRYVEDGSNIFLVEPENHEKYGEKLIFIIENYEDALKIAQNGKQLIHENFSNISQALKMLRFLLSLSGKQTKIQN